VQQLITISYKAYQFIINLYLFYEAGAHASFVPLDTLVHCRSSTP
jgi:hypothetical protein